MLSRYGDISYVLKLPVYRAAKLIDIAASEKRREYYYAQWLMHLTKMTKDTFVPFEEYYEETKVKLDTRSKHEIMQDLLGMSEDGF